VENPQLTDRFGGIIGVEYNIKMDKINKITGNYHDGFWLEALIAYQRLPVRQFGDETRFGDLFMIRK